MIRSLSYIVALICFFSFTVKAGISWPDVSTVAKSDMVLVVTIGGADLLNNENNVFNGFANNFKGNNIIVATGKPDLMISTQKISQNGLTFNEKYFEPSASAIASTIMGIAARMNPARKIILAGKSMGGCLLQEALTDLNTNGVKVNLLILVDPNCSMGCISAICDTKSCGIGCESGITKSIPGNVIDAYDLYQRSCDEGTICLPPVCIPLIPFPPAVLIISHQCGFHISGPSVRGNIDVNHPNALTGGSQLCSGVVHSTIDGCAGVQNFVTSLINQEIGKARGIQVIPAIINLIEN